jgi:hypothetical protein
MYSNEWVQQSFVRNNVSACFIKHVYHNMLKHCCERRIVVLIHCYMHNRMHSPNIKKCIAFFFYFFFIFYFLFYFFYENPVYLQSVRIHSAMGTSHMSDIRQKSVAMQRLVDLISMVTNSKLLCNNTRANNTEPTTLCNNTRAVTIWFMKNY